MKWFKKLNRGLILTVVLILAIVIYLVVVAAVHRADVPIVKSVVEEYAQAELAWQMLPEENRDGSQAISDEALAAFIAQQADKIESFYIDNDAIVNPLIQRMSDNLEAQAAGKNVILVFQKAIGKYGSVTFDKDLATVRFSMQTVLETADSDGRMVEETQDSMILQKNGDRWDVVYSELNRPYDPYGYSDYAKVEPVIR